jgi:rod shape-determining protein MreC
MTPALRERAAPLLLVGVLTGLLALMSADVRSGESNLLARAVFRVAAPVVRACSGSVSFARGLWARYVDLRGARLESEDLRRRVEALELERSRFGEVLEENERLRALLQFRERLGGRPLAARIIANGARAAQRSVLLDRGTRDGVRADMPVFAPGGVVGRVVAAAPRSAKVQLLTDAGSATAVTVARTRLHALARGRGGDRLWLDWVPQLEDVRPGDRLVTSGLDGVYPPGFPVGTVLTVLGGPGPMIGIEAAPAVDAARLEEVLLLSPAEEGDGGEAGAGP